MASGLELEATTRRWRRVEYERLVDLGVFTGERLELLDGVLVVREPQGSYHAAVTTKIARVLATAFGARWHTRQHSPLALGERSEPEPDIAVVAGEPEDYLAAQGTVVLPPGTTSTNIFVSIVGDTAIEPDETFTVTLRAPSGAPLAAEQGEDKAGFLQRARDAVQALAP